jgi:hypothetical protein
MYDIDRMCKDLWRWINANPCGYDKPEKEFGAFKQAAFQTSAMPTLSSSRRSTPMKVKPPPSPGKGAAAVDSNSVREEFAMRGRGTSMDDLLAEGATGDETEECIPFRGRGTSMDDLLSGGGGGASFSKSNSSEVGVGESF